jgi:hypothetical protein
MPPFSLEKGASAPYLREKGVPTKKMIPKCTIPTEISFGIGMVNTEKYRPIPTGKFRFDEFVSYKLI